MMTCSFNQEEFLVGGFVSNSEQSLQRDSYCRTIVLVDQICKVGVRRNVRNLVDL